MAPARLRFKLNHWRSDAGALSSWLYRGEIRMRDLARLALAACVLFGPGAALADDATRNLRFYSTLDEPVSITVDGAVLERAFPPNSEGLFTVQPGPHQVTVKLAAQTVSTAVDFEPENVAEARGGRWWCVGVGIRTTDNTVRLFQFKPDSCARMTNLAPPGRP
jgi:hypothetical protein